MKKHLIIYAKVTKPFERLVPYSILDIIIVCEVSTKTSKLKTLVDLQFSYIYRS